MQNLMSRRFTTREKVLLLLLIVILLVGLYFFLVYYPVKNDLEEIEQQKNDIADRQTIAEARETVYDKMQAELEEIFKMPEGQITTMPAFDNFQELMRRFDVIFADVDPSLSFGSPQRDDNGIVKRSIQFSFRTADYNQAKSILKNLISTGYRCQISNFSLSPASGDLESDQLSVSGTITFYEIDK